MSVSPNAFSAPAGEQNILICTKVRFTTGLPIMWDSKGKPFETVASNAFYPTDDMSEAECVERAWADYWSRLREYLSTQRAAIVEWRTAPKLDKTKVYPNPDMTGTPRDAVRVFSRFGIIEHLPQPEMAAA